MQVKTQGRRSRNVPAFWQSLCAAGIAGGSSLTQHSRHSQRDGRYQLLSAAGITLGMRAKGPLSPWGALQPPIRQLSPKQGTRAGHGGKLPEHIQSLSCHSRLGEEKWRTARERDIAAPPAELFFPFSPWKEPLRNPNLEQPGRFCEGVRASGWVTGSQPISHMEWHFPAWKLSLLQLFSAIS